MKNFFVSYNKADRSWAEWIAWQLEEKGYKVVIQAWDFRSGSNFVLDMDEAVEAERTIAVLSSDYLNALYTKPEWAAAFAEDPTGKKGKLLPVRVRECEPKRLLRLIVCIDLLGLNEEDAKKELLDGVRREQVKPSSPPGFPGTRSLPVEPRFPGTLPPHWNVPHRRNPNFTGRTSLLNNLHDALTSGQYAALTQAITGLGGVGKTQIALEYSYHYMDDYQIVWWIRSEKPATLALDYSNLAESLKLDVEAGKEIEAVRYWLDRHPGWLLVFDNAGSPSDILKTLPQGNAGHVIITSRDRDWEKVLESINVKEFESSESIDFLIRPNRAGRQRGRQIAS